MFGRRAAAIAVGTLLACCAAGEAGAGGGWLEIGGERSGVSLAENAWWAGRVEAGFQRDGRGGASLAVESLARFGARDVAIGAGGYWHSGPWTVSARAGFTPNADFQPGLTLETGLARRVVGTWVGHAGYRLLQFQSATVHVVSPAVTWYGPRGEVHLRGFASRNVTAGTSGGALLLSASWQFGSRLRLEAGAAHGERIFDFAPRSDQPASGYVVFAGARLQATARDTIGIDLRLAGEEPAFRQRSFGLTFRRSF